MRIPLGKGGQRQNEFESLPRLGGDGRSERKGIARVRVWIGQAAGGLTDRQRKSERLIGGNVVQRLLPDIRIKNAPTAAHAGLAVAEEIVGEAETRTPVVEPRAEAGAGDAGIAGENVTGRRGGKQRGLLSGLELRDGVLQIAIG